MVACIYISFIYIYIYIYIYICVFLLLLLGDDPIWLEGLRGASIVFAALEQSSQRQGAALLASLALTRRRMEPDDVKAQRRYQSSRFRRTLSQSSKASSWVSLAEAESLPDPDKEDTCPCSCSTEDFEFLAALGKGSCGSVSKVSHKFTGEIYALKAIQRLRVREHQLQEYVVREVATQKQLKHPNIVKLYEHFQDEENLYLLLEFAPEGSLYSKIRAQHSLAHAEAASVFVDVSEALAHLHKHGVAHRDLKPENVLLFPGGRAKLADFGWCAELTKDGRKTFCGTMDYLSPEMVSQRPHDHRVDIWGLGVLLYEMMTGDPPFAGMNNVQVLECILSANFIMPVSMPDGAADLIHALLKVNPEERLSLSAALCWPWLQKMRTDPLETDDEVAIPIDDTETEPLPEAKTSAFLLSSCLEPASGLHFRHVANMPPDISSRKHLAKHCSDGRCWEVKAADVRFQFYDFALGWFRSIYIIC